MKKLNENPVLIIGGTLLLLIMLILLFIPNARCQVKPKQDSIQVYQFQVLPTNLNNGIKILQDKFLKNGTISDTVLLNSSLQMILGNGKMIKIANPEKKIITNPKK